MFVVLLMHSFEITKVKFKRMARAFGLLIYCYEKKSATREPRLGVSWEQNELRTGIPQRKQNRIAQAKKFAYGF